jgi:glycosyltransferase involved in cell wall biosynthesis
MKVVYLITGSGGSFYCGNCYRDMIFLRSIKNIPGINARAIPLYLPPDQEGSEGSIDSNVFFGAISMYLRQKVRLLRNMPAIFDKVVDSGPLLRIAAKRSGTTNTEGLEDMTLGMIKGEDAFPENELKRLINYLSENGKPDIIHLSNALIIGLARQIKKHLDVKIVCSLLNEDDWIDEMTEPYQTEAWRMIGEEAHNVDAFMTPSKYYRDLFMEKTLVSGNNIHVVPLALDTRNLNILPPGNNYPSLGYFSRVNSSNGFDKLVDAFIELKTSGKLPELTLHISGGFTGSDKPFISKQIFRIKEHGLKGSVRIYPDFHTTGKEEFFSNIDIMSVPVRKHDGYGLYLLEANAAGVPVVQPATGAFPEIIEKTRGGIAYEPDTSEALADTLLKLFSDHELRKKLGGNGKTSVPEEFSLQKMSQGLLTVYNGIFKI